MRGGVKYEIINRLILLFVINNSMKKYFVLALLAVALIVPSGVFAQVQVGTCRSGDVYNLMMGGVMSERKH